MLGNQSLQVMNSSQWALLVQHLIPPNVRTMRCVPKSWLRESTFVHKVWDDSGSGGREGSIWLFNTMNLAGFVAGHDPPARRPWDLRSRRFFLRDYSDIRSEAARHNRR
eukprot:780264_1